MRLRLLQLATHHLRRRRAAIYYSGLEESSGDVLRNSRGGFTHPNHLMTES